MTLNKNYVKVDTICVICIIKIWQNTFYKDILFMSELNKHLDHRLSEVDNETSVIIKSIKNNKSQYWSKQFNNIELKALSL
jgi:hypothetical protein